MRFQTAHIEPVSPVEAPLALPTEARTSRASRSPGLDTLEPAS